MLPGNLPPATPRGQKFSPAFSPYSFELHVSLLTTRPRKVSYYGDTWVKRWAWIHTQSRDSTTRQHSCSLIVIVSGRLPQGVHIDEHCTRLPCSMGHGDKVIIPICQAWLAWLLSLLSPACGRRLFSLGRLTGAGPASYSGHSCSLGAHRHTRLQHSTATLRKPALYVCVCTLSPGWSPSSVVRMHMALTPPLHHGSPPAPLHHSSPPTPHVTS